MSKLDSIHQEILHRTHLDTMYWNHLEHCEYIAVKSYIPYHPDTNIGVKPGRVRP